MGRVACPGCGVSTVVNAPGHYRCQCGVKYGVDAGGGVYVPRPGERPAQGEAPSTQVVPTHRSRWGRLPTRQKIAAYVTLFIAVLIVRFIIDDYRHPIIRCYVRSSNSWTVYAEITGRGSRTADQDFNAHVMDRVIEEGYDLGRTYRGQRFKVVVRPETGSSFAEVAPGKLYIVWGTVESMHYGNMRLTNAVFAEAVDK